MKYSFLEIPRVTSHQSKVLPQFSNGHKDISIVAQRNEEDRSRNDYKSTLHKKFQSIKLFYEQHQGSFNEGSKTNPKLKEDFLVVRFVYLTQSFYEIFKSEINFSTTLC